jgi:hypothetical protein
MIGSERKLLGLLLKSDQHLMSGNYYLIWIGKL